MEYFLTAFSYLVYSHIRVPLILTWSVVSYPCGLHCLILLYYRFPTEKSMKTITYG